MKYSECISEGSADLVDQLFELVNSNKKFRRINKIVDQKLVSNKIGEFFLIEDYDITKRSASIRYKISSVNGKVYLRARYSLEVLFIAWIGIVVQSLLFIGLYFGWFKIAFFENKMWVFGYWLFAFFYMH